MRLANGQLSFSATDLSRHLACTHLTSLRRAVACGKLEPPTPYDDPRAEVLKQRGIELEQRLLDQCETDGRTVEAIIGADTPFSHRDPVAAAARTRDAMQRGADVIYQGHLEDDVGRWSGYPDFLLRVDRPSALGGWSYEVLDTKLARRAKGEALLQILLYSDLLAQAQGIEPELMHLALGGDGNENPASFRVAEYAAYYRAVRRRFEAHAASPPNTYPEPVEHCGICEWQQSCAERRRADDHLSLVAGITRGQRGPAGRTRGDDDGGAGRATPAGLSPARRDRRGRAGPHPRAGAGAGPGAARGPPHPRARRASAGIELVTAPQVLACRVGQGGPAVPRRLSQREDGLRLFSLLRETAPSPTASGGSGRRPALGLRGRRGRPGPGGRQARRAVAGRTRRPPPAGAGSVVNRCGGGWSAVADAPAAPGLAQQTPPSPCDSLRDARLRPAGTPASCRPAAAEG